MCLVLPSTLCVQCAPFPNVCAVCSLPPLFVRCAPPGRSFDTEMDRAGGLPADLLHEELDDWDHIAARGLKGMVNGGLASGGGAKHGEAGGGEGEGKGKGAGKGEGGHGEGGEGGAYGERDDGAAQGVGGTEEGSGGSGSEEEGDGQAQQQGEKRGNADTASSSSSSSSSTSSAMSGFNFERFEKSLRKSFRDRSHRSIIKIEEDRSCSLPRPLKPCRLPAGERIHVIFVSAMWNREAHTKVRHFLSSAPNSASFLTEILFTVLLKLSPDGTCRASHDGPLFFWCHESSFFYSEWVHSNEENNMLCAIG